MVALKVALNARPDPRGAEELAAAARLDAAFAELQRQARARAFWAAVDARRGQVPELRLASRRGVPAYLTLRTVGKAADVDRRTRP